MLSSNREPVIVSTPFELMIFIVPLKVPLTSPLKSVTPPRAFTLSIPVPLRVSRFEI